MLIWVKRYSKDLFLKLNYVEMSSLSLCKLLCTFDSFVSYFSDY